MPNRRRPSPNLSPWLWVPVLLLLLPVALASLYALLPVPVTPLMLIRLAQGHPIHAPWTPLNRMAPALPRAAIAAEDTLFCQHHGFDWKALGTAFDTWQDNADFSATRKQKGGSTISQQTAKNVFLWPGRDLIRKALEFPLTVLIETLWGKRRILEVYLNVAEFGPGLYGVTAASQAYFHTTPDKLSPAQAARLIAVLPSPLRWSVTNPGAYVRSRARRIQLRAQIITPYATCLGR